MYYLTALYGHSRSDGDTNPFKRIQAVDLRSAKTYARLFGGAFVTHGIGSFMDEAGRIMLENCSFLHCLAHTVTDENWKDLTRLATGIGETLGQESVLLAKLETEGHMELVSSYGVPIGSGRRVWQPAAS